MVGSTAWTDRLPEPDRAAFVDELVSTYQVTAGRPRAVPLHADAGRTAPADRGAPAVFG